METALAPGAALARGVRRHLRSLGFATLSEFVPTPGLRVDVIAIGPKCEIWVVECKSCRADFTSDRKWEGYLPWCDRFFWAVDPDFPAEILPSPGLICADGYDAEILRMPDAERLSSPRRRSIMERFARTAAERLAQLDDPEPGRRRFPLPAAGEEP